MASKTVSPDKIPLISKEETADHRIEERKEDEADDPSSADEELSLTNWQVMMHLIRAFVGIGLLGYPSGFSHTGIVMGPIVLIFIAVANCYGMSLLASTLEETSRRTGNRSYTYGNLAWEIIAFHSEFLGHFSKVLLDTLLCAMQLGFCTVYLEFFGAAMAKIVNYAHPRLWTVAFLPMVIGLAVIPNIRKLVFTSIIANLAVIIVVLILLPYFIPKMRLPKHDQLFTNPVAVLVGFGQFLYGFEGNGTLPTLQSKIKDKGKFKKILIKAQVIATILYFSVGLTGYLAYGSKTKPSITFNLPNEPLYQGFNVAFILISLSSYPLQFFVPIEIILSYVDQQCPKRKSVLAETGLRIALVLFTCALAVGIPQLDNYMALISSSTGTVVTFIFPPILHTLCFWNEGLKKWQLVLNSIYIVLGIFSFLCGTFSAIVAIINRFQNPNAS